MSDSKKYYYLKLKENFFEQDEFKAIAAEQNGWEYIAIILKMYLRSLKRDGKLVVADLVPYDLKTLAGVLGHPEETVRAAILLFKRYKLIDILNDETIYMMNIQNFIGESSTEADRIRAFRKGIEEHRKGVTFVRQLNDKSTPEIRDKSTEIREEPVEPAKRDLIKSETELKEADFILRFHKAEEFALFVNVVKQMIQNENAERGGRNPFTWTPTSKRGTIEADLTNLIYKFNDDKKRELLRAVYNVVEYKLNWPHLVKLAILHTIRTSRSTPIKKPHDFVMWFIQRPADIAASKAEGPLSEKWIPQIERSRR
jgi:predicted phage replisome organizer